MKAPVNIGDVLAGKYRVERVLGAGAMGIVVACRHLHLDERVAIKFLLPETLKDANVIARFLREGRAAAKIRSEHVARVYDVGSLENGAPYLVMEYLEGSDLASLIKVRGALPVPTAVEYTLQTCEAIAEAHALGIVHRDIKPSNLFITTRPDGSPAIKVIDFGISKVTAGDGLVMTNTAEVRGSPLFMSPEQMRSTREADARSDLWAIGVSLYHLLTGAYPFYADSIMELCSLVLQDEPVPLRARRADLPAGLESIIARCLRKNPAQRYGNVAEFAAALGEFAPPLARLSVDRISRVLGVPGSHAPGSLPSSPTTGMISTVNSALPNEAPTQRLPSPSTSTVAPLAATEGTALQAQTGAASSGSTAVPPRKRPITMIVASTFIGIVTVAAITLILRIDREQAPAPSASTVAEEILPANSSPTPSVVADLPSVVPSSPSAQLPATAPSALRPLVALSAAARPSPAPPSALPQAVPTGTTPTASRDSSDVYNPRRDAPTTTTPTATATQKPPLKEIF